MACSTPSRGSRARCEAPPRQLERPGEPPRGRRRDPPARDLRATGAGRRRTPPRDRPGDERLAGVRVRGGARRDAGAPRGRASQLRAARAQCGPLPAGRASLRRGRGGHQQAAPLPADADAAAPVRDRAASLRDDRVRRGELAPGDARRADLVLEIAGHGDDRPRLERLAHRLGVAEAVRFLGFVTEEEKRRRLRAAWAVVFPSPKEGWGISNVEAAACGTPAIASDSPGLRESVRHGETGFLVPHGDAAALAERMVALASDPLLVTGLGRAARAFAERLSWERAARATEAHLERVIARGG